MRVRIHKPWKDDSAADVNFFGFSRGRQLLDFCRRADRKNSAFPNQQSAVGNYAELRQRLSAPRSATAQRQKLRCSSNEKSLTQGLVIMTNLAPLWPISVRRVVRPELQAFADLALYAGAKTSFANASSVVVVVFFSERASVASISPSLIASFISLISAAVFAGKPICFSACSTMNAGNFW